MQKVQPSLSGLWALLALTAAFPVEAAGATCTATVEVVDAVEAGHLEECTDGSSCDSDATVNGECSFHVRICLPSGTGSGCEAQIARRANRAVRRANRASAPPLAALLRAF